MSLAPLHPWEWPSAPWERVHVDFAGPFMDSMFLVLVCAHSKWPEVVQMKTTTSTKTITTRNYELRPSYGLLPDVLHEANLEYGNATLRARLHEFPK
jgi:hypothetical protein